LPQGVLAVLRWAALPYRMFPDTLARFLAKRLLQAFDVDCGDDFGGYVVVADGDGLTVAGAKAYEVVQQLVIGELEALSDLGLIVRADNLIRDKLRAGYKADCLHVFGEAAGAVGGLGNARGADVCSLARLALDKAVVAQVVEGLIDRHARKAKVVDKFLLGHDARSNGIRAVDNAIFNE